MLPFRSVPVLAACLAVSLLAAPAAAFPGFFAAKDARPRLIHETHVTLMIQGDRTVVTVMPDFEGPMEPFLVVLPVPADVTLERIKAFRREFIDRIDVISAPRYHEFWEMDPCEPGPPEQEWERNLKANAETAFLGGFEDKGATRKVDKEMFIKVEPQFKEGEYTFSLLDENDSKNLGDWMKREGWTPPPGALDAIRPHVEGGMRVLVAQVDTNKIELVGATKGILSPIRFWSTSYPRIPARLGLVNARDEQELVLYVLHPTERFEVKNFPNVPAPTNVKAKLEPVKERMGEFWAALHDMLLEKNPKAFILQYAWHSRGCGQPCPNAPLEPSELLTLGGDVFEQALPEEVRHPEPPEMTEEEKKALADAGRKEKKEAEEERKEVYRRKALIERLQYVVTRLHHRYDKATLTADPELGPASHLRGGIDIPKGQGAEIPTEAKQDARDHGASLEGHDAVREAGAASLGQGAARLPRAAPDLGRPGHRDARPQGDQARRGRGVRGAVPGTVGRAGGGRRRSGRRARGRREEEQGLRLRRAGARGCARSGGARAGSGAGDRAGGTASRRLARSRRENRNAARTSEKSPHGAGNFLGGERRTRCEPRGSEKFPRLPARARAAPRRAGAAASGEGAPRRGARHGASAVFAAHRERWVARLVAPMTRPLRDELAREKIVARWSIAAHARLASRSTSPALWPSPGWSSRAGSTGSSTSRISPFFAAIWPGAVRAASGFSRDSCRDSLVLDSSARCPGSRGCSSPGWRSPLAAPSASGSIRPA
jgi:hypothetical protein